MSKMRKIDFLHTSILQGKQHIIQINERTINFLFSMHKLPLIVYSLYIACDKLQFSLNYMIKIWGQFVIVAKPDIKISKSILLH